MAHDGPLLTQQPAQPLTPTTAQRNGAMGRRSRASGFDSPGGHWVATYAVIRWQQKLKKQNNPSADTVAIQ